MIYSRHSKKTKTVELASGVPEPVNKRTRNVVDVMLSTCATIIEPVLDMVVNTLRGMVCP